MVYKSKGSSKQKEDKAHEMVPLIHYNSTLVLGCMRPVFDEFVPRIFSTGDTIGKFTMLYPLADKPYTQTLVEFRIFTQLQYPGGNNQA